MSPKGLFGKIKQRGITLTKSWKLGGQPVDIEHSVRKELERAKITGTLRKTKVVLDLLLEDGEKPTVTGLRNLRKEVLRRLSELGKYLDS